MNDWFGYTGGSFDTVTPAVPKKHKRAETDAELRERLLYVAGDGNYLQQRIQRAVGEDLESVAACFNLKRRTIEE